MESVEHAILDQHTMVMIVFAITDSMVIEIYVSPAILLVENVLDLKLINVLHALIFLLF